MSRRRFPPAQRDQVESAFAAILAGLVERVPGARAAALVDVDGETVDYASRSDPFEIRLAAAHLRIVLREVQAAHGEACTTWVRASARSYLARALPQGYALIVVFSCGVAMTGTGRALPVCVRGLAIEAGWDPPPALAWHPINVRVDERGRPLGLGPHQSPGFEILGVLATGLSRFERGWRVRLAGGEATVVREPGGYWYIDEGHLAVARPREELR